jgi:hypothetical protein
MVEPLFRLSGRRVAIGLTAAVALVHGVSIWHAGVHLSSDSGLYARWADRLVAQRFDVAAFLRDTRFVVPPILYLGWIAVVAVAKLLFGASWAAAVVAFNWGLFAVLVYLTLSTIQSLTHSTRAIILGALLFLAAADFLIIEPFVLSDVVFVALSTAVLAAALRGTRLALAAGTICLLVACIVRPTAAPLVVVWILALIVRGGTVTARQLAGGAIVIAPLLTIAVLVHARLMMRPDLWPVAAGSAWIQQLGREYHRGIVVFDRPGTFAPPPVGYGAFVALTLRKWLFFFAPFMTDYTAAHKALNLLFFAPLYIFGAVALLAWRDRRRKALLVVYVLAFSAFHAVQQIDFDYRYRLPVLPALIVMAGVGWAVCDPSREAPRE